MTIFRFDDFTFDSTRGQLLRGSEDMGLRPQTARFLAFVLRHRTHLITREELVEGVWGQEHVNDQAVFQCVNQLRKALGESGRQPKYLKTIPRRGYRWMHEAVREEEPEQPPIPTQEPVSKQPDLVTGSMRAVPEKKTRTSIAPLTTVAILFLAALAWLQFGHNSRSDVLARAEGERKRIAFLPIHNGTGETRLAWVELGLMDLLLRAVAEPSSTDPSAEGLSTVPPERVFKALSAQGLPRAGTVDEQTALSLRSHLGVQWLISASIRVYQNAYLMEAVIVDDQGTVTRRQWTGPEPADLAMRVAGELRGDITGQRAPVARALSKDAFVNQSYALGLQADYDGQTRKALPYYEVCLQKDPRFLWPAYRLADCRLRLGMRAEAEQLIADSLRQARQSNDTVAGDLISLQASLALDDDNLEQARDLYQEALRWWRQLGDREGEILAMLNLANVHDALNEPDKTDQWYQQALDAARAMGDRFAEAITLSGMAAVAFERGQDTEGEQMQNQEYAVWEALEAHAAMALTQLDRYHRALLAHNWDQAANHLDEAEQLARTADDRAVLFDVLLGRGELALERMQWRDAAAAFEQAAVLLQDLEDPELALEVRLMQTKLGALEPNPNQILHADEAQALAARLKDQEAQIFIAACRADYAFNSGNPDEAARVIKAVTEMVEPSHPILRLLQARTAFEAGRTTEAAALQAAVKQDHPQIWDSYEERLLLRYQGGQ